MKNLVLFCCCILSCALAAETPVVSQVTLTQDPATRVATVTYRLTGADAIITLDVRTNGVSIGAANIVRVAGDVCRKVAADADAVRTITWWPERSWSTDLAEAKAVVRAWTTDDPPQYMVVDVVDGSTTYHECAEALPHGGVLASDLYRTTKMAFRRIPAAGATFMMGSPSTELGRAGYAAQEDYHSVTLTNDFYLGVFQVTQRQWEYVMGDMMRFAYTNRLYYATRPVSGLRYVDVRGPTAEADWPTMGHVVSPTNFLGRLRTLTGLNGFDLPTDAEWEFACRAGTTTALNSGEDLTNTSTCPRLARLARYAGNGGKTANGNYYDAAKADDTQGTVRVGQYAPNAFELYDMHGNVWEWCLDWYKQSLGTSAVTAPVGPDSGTERVGKGGAHGSAAQACRSAYRRHSGPNTKDRDSNNGVRVAYVIGL